MDEVLPIAKQIADALEAAHEQGIIHRDLKPANVKLRPDGTVKVLDFGLAKALEAAPASADPTNSPTITSPAATRLGVILGTAAYMSPKQARGKVVDQRADIWAFGCVLYEMLTGRRAFAGEEVTDTPAAVVRSEPQWDTLPDAISPSLRAVLRRCLHKESKQRVRDIGDLRLALEGAFETRATQAVGSIAIRQPAWRRAIVPLTTLIVGCVAAGGAVWLAVRPAPPPVVRIEVTTSGGVALSIQGLDRDLAITPDGSRIVYRGTNQLLVRALDRLEPTALSGLGAPRGIFVSPDGQWVGFFEGTSVLKKVAFTGGPPVTLVDGSGLRGATWGEDDAIVYATNGGATGLQRVSSAGGEPTVLTTPDHERGEGDHLWPEFLPGGQAVLVTITAVAGGLDNAQVAVLDLRTGTSKTVLRGGHHAHYVPTGHLVYGAAGTLRAVPFDVGGFEVIGPPVVLRENAPQTGDDPRSAPTRSSRPSARAAWGKSTKPVTPASTAPSPSRSCPHMSPPITG